MGYSTCAMHGHRSAGPRCCDGCDDCPRCSGQKFRWVRCSYCGGSYFCPACTVKYAAKQRAYCRQHCQRVEPQPALFNYYMVSGEDQ